MITALTNEDKKKLAEVGFCCVVCGQYLDANHKCQPKAERNHESRLRIKDEQRVSRCRYGEDETVGDRIDAGFNFTKGNESFDAPKG
jgi:hypothetical protein